MIETTTIEEDKASAARRQLNFTWEYTQAGIALLVTCAGVYLSLSTPTNYELLKSAFFLVIGFYFGRTNHTRPIGN